MAATTTAPALLSTSQAARRANVASETVRHWVRAGHLAAVATPLAMRIPSAALDAWLAARAAHRHPGQ